MDRYTIFIIVAYSILIGVIASEPELNHWAFKFFIGLMLILQKFTTDEIDNFDYDVSMGYTAYVETQDHSIDYCLQNLHAGDTLFANFPVTYGLRDSRFGYCDTTQIRFVRVSKSEIHSADYFLIADPGAYDHQLPPPDSLEVMKVFKSEVASITILKRKSP